MALEDIDIYALTGAGSPLENVTVGLYNSVTKVKLLTSATDVNGKATFVAVDSDTNAGKYEIRVNPGFPGVVSGGTVQTVTVLAAPVAPLSNIFDVIITPPSLSVATNTNLCRCSGFFKDASGRYLNDVVLKFTQHNMPAISYQADSSIGTYPIVPLEVSVRTSKDLATNTKGYASVDLYRGAMYSVTMSGYVGKPRIIQIPDTSAVNIADVLFPVVSQVRWYNAGVQIVPAGSPTLNMGVEDKTLTYEAVFRSGVLADLGEVVVTSADKAVVTVSITGAEIKLTGVGAGTTTLEITRASTAESGILTQSSIPPVSGSLTVNVA